MLAGLTSFEEFAQCTVSNQAPIKVDVSEVAEACTAAQRHLSLFVSMLNSLG